MADHDEPTIDQLNEEADIAADYLEGLLDIADYDGDIEMGVRNGRAMVQIVADDDTDIKHLTGKNGDVVEALQRLTRLAVQEKTGERSHLILDVDGYLKKKRAGLHQQAMDAIEEARSSGEPVELDPMNSFERKIVHDVVREEGLKSRSHGEEPHRYVTVYVRKAVEDSEDDLDDDDIDDAAAEDVSQVARPAADLSGEPADDDEDADAGADDDTVIVEDETEVIADDDDDLDIETEVDDDSDDSDDDADEDSESDDDDSDDDTDDTDDSDSKE